LRASEPALSLPKGSLHPLAAPHARSSPLLCPCEEHPLPRILKTYRYAATGSRSLENLPCVLAGCPAFLEGLSFRTGRQAGQAVDDVNTCPGYSATIVILRPAFFAGLRTSVLARSSTSPLLARATSTAKSIRCPESSRRVVTLQPGAAHSGTFHALCGLPRVSRRIVIPNRASSPVRRSTMSILVQPPALIVILRPASFAGLRTSARACSSTYRTPRRAVSNAQSIRHRGASRPLFTATEPPVIPSHSWGLFIASQET
jgi:hypothetical protein